MRAISNLELTVRIRGTEGGALECKKGVKCRAGARICLANTLSGLMVGAPRHPKPALRAGGDGRCTAAPMSVRSPGRRRSEAIRRNIRPDTTLRASVGFAAASGAESPPGGRMRTKVNLLAVCAGNGSISGRLMTVRK